MYVLHWYRSRISCSNHLKEDKTILWKASSIRNGTSTVSYPCLLYTSMAECSKAFEQLPLIDDIDILRNVLYSGVWYRYEQVREKREKEKEEKNV